MYLYVDVIDEAIADAASSNKKQITFKGKPILMTAANTMHIGHSPGTEFMDGTIDEAKSGTSR